MILIALGANLPSSSGNPSATIRAALKALEKHGVPADAVSSFYKSDAWPDPSDPPFVNAVARVRTSLQPKGLLTLLHMVETEFGRVRSRRNAPRTLDLDLVDYNGNILKDGIELPHPRLADRAFVLIPLRDVAPDWRHPVSGQSLEALIAALPVSKLERLAD
jgi:2-amino-4-hydroxy-6-hydroxymethyldihydropteridine diphosphokinase